MNLLSLVSCSLISLVSIFSSSSKVNSNSRVFNDIENKMTISQIDDRLSYHVALTDNQVFSYDLNDSLEYPKMKYYCFSYGGRDVRDFQYEEVVSSSYDGYTDGDFDTYAITHVSTEVTRDYSFILAVAYWDVGDDLQLLYMPLFSNIFDKQYACINYNDSNHLNVNNMYLYNANEDYSSGHQVNTYTRHLDYCFYDSIYECDNTSYKYRFIQSYGGVSVVTQYTGNFAFNLKCMYAFNRDGVFAEGFDTGYTQGYDNGYNDGLTDGNDYSFGALFGAIADTPVLIVRNLFDFDFFGVNLLTVVLSLFTGLILFYLLRKLL